MVCHPVDIDTLVLIGVARDGPIALEVDRALVVSSTAIAPFSRTPPAVVIVQLPFNTGFEGIWPPSLHCIAKFRSVGRRKEEATGEKVEIIPPDFSQCTARQPRSSRTYTLIKVSTFHQIPILWRVDEIRIGAAGILVGELVEILPSTEGQQERCDS